MKLPRPSEIAKLYLTFGGRISQETFWWGTLWLYGVVAVVTGIGAAIASEALFRGAAFQSAVAGAAPNVDDFEQLLAPLQAMLYLTLAVIIVTFVPTAALLIKRRHDRDSRGILAWVFMVLLPLPYIYFAFATAAPANPQVLALGFVPMLAIPALFGLGIHLFVVCGIFDGTKGPNRYGPDPLEKAPPAA